jgi:hypothetical protein
MMTDCTFVNKESHLVPMDEQEGCETRLMSDGIATEIAEGDCYNMKVSGVLCSARRLS